MSDVTLVVDGKEFNAHRLFLCSLSDVFQVMYNFIIFHDSVLSWCFIGDVDETGMDGMA